MARWHTGVVDKADPGRERVAAVMAGLTSALVAASFPVFGVESPHYGEPMVGDGHVRGHQVHSIGILYGNPLTAGPIVQVITAPVELATSIDHLIDVEMLGTEGTRSQRSVQGTCRVAVAGTVAEVPVTHDGDWWGFQLQRDGVMVSVVGNAAVPLEVDLAEVDLAFLVNDRDRALAARFTDARNAAT